MLDTMSNIHDTDFYTWTQQQASLLRQGCLAQLDVTNLIDEIEDMGRSEKRELQHRLVLLLAHLLKWCYQPAKRTVSWEATIKSQRLDVQEVIQENPGLKPILLQKFYTAYEKARLQAVRETKLAITHFPVICPWTIEQTMADDFWPEAIAQDTVC